MAPQPGNLLMGPATLYHGLFGAPIPAALNSTPAASAWTDIGITNGGVSFGVNPTYKEFEADQIIDVPGARLVGRKIMFTTTMSEATLDNVRRALNGTPNSITSPTVGVSRFTPDYGPNASQQAYCAILMDGLAPSVTGVAKRRRVVARKILSTDELKLGYKKDDQVGIPVTFSAYYVDSTTEPFYIDDDTSA